MPLLFIFPLLLTACAFCYNFPVSCLLQLYETFAMHYLTATERLCYTHIVAAIWDKTSGFGSLEVDGNKRQICMSLEKQGGIRGLCNVNDAIILFGLSPAIC